METTEDPTAIVGTIDLADPPPASPYCRESATTAKLYAALVKCFGELNNIEKNQTATIPTKNGKSYGYNYADLGSVLVASREIIASNGLAVVQLPTRSRDGDVTLVGVATRIIHESGEWIEFDPIDMPLESNPTAQTIGSALTYSRRYSFQAAFSLATVDDDGGEATRSNARIRRGGGAPGSDYDPDATILSTTVKDVKRRIVEMLDGDTGAAAACWADLAIPAENHWCANSDLADLDDRVSSWKAENVHVPPAADDHGDERARRAERARAEVEEQTAAIETEAAG